MDNFLCSSLLVVHHITIRYVRKLTLIDPLVALMWLFNDALNHSWVSPTPWKKNCGSSVTEEEKQNVDEKSPMAGK